MEDKLLGASKYRAAKAGHKSWTKNTLLEEEPKNLGMVRPPPTHNSGNA